MIYLQIYFDSSHANKYKSSVISLENCADQTLAWHGHMQSEQPLPMYVNSPVLQQFAFSSEYNILEHTHTHKRPVGNLLSLRQIVPLLQKCSYVYLQSCSS